MKKAVLFIVYNRLNTTKKVFTQIRKAKPPRLYIASDGPKSDNLKEKKDVFNIRKYVESQVDWDCKTKHLYRRKNLGCGKAVSSAVTWFLKHEEDGIILEDDCLPNPSFFYFCEKLLDYYRDDKRVYHISGNQFINNYRNKYSYYFARIQHCWGWATWANRWKKYIFNPRKITENIISKFSLDKNIKAYWMFMLKSLKNGYIDTWDIQWTFAIIKNNGLCINPTRNLVSNIGFGNKGTHTFNKDFRYANLKTYPIKKIIHQPFVALDREAELIYQNYFRKIHVKSSVS